MLSLITFLRAFSQRLSAVVIIILEFALHHLIHFSSRLAIFGCWADLGIILYLKTVSQGGIVHNLVGLDFTKRHHFFVDLGLDLLIHIWLKSFGVGLLLHLIFEKSAGTHDFRRKHHFQEFCRFVFKALEGKDGQHIVLCLLKEQNVILQAPAPHRILHPKLIDHGTFGCPNLE